MRRIEDEGDAVLFLDQALDHLTVDPLAGNRPHLSPQDSLGSVARNREQLGAEPQYEQLLRRIDIGGGKVQEAPDVNNWAGRPVTVDHAEQVRARPWQGSDPNHCSDFLEVCNRQRAAEAADGELHHRASLSGVHQSCRAHAGPSGGSLGFEDFRVPNDGWVALEAYSTWEQARLIRLIPYGLRRSALHVAIRRHCYGPLRTNGLRPLRLSRPSCF